MSSPIVVTTEFIYSNFESQLYVQKYFTEATVKVQKRGQPHLKWDMTK